jgi:enoyl-CoA hydratase/carnithine racemase
MSDRVTIDIQHGVADVRLNRADKMNAIDQPMFASLIEAGLQLAEDKSLRAVVLSGEGRAFCAGLDFSSFASMADGNASNRAAASKESSKEPALLRASGDSPANFAQRAAWVWQEVPVPVVAALHGVAYGGGLQIALGADIRFATRDTKLSVMEVKWGLIPDMSGTQTLRHLVRLDVAKELTFTGRVITGEEALELGLVTHVVDNPLEAATTLALEIASKSPSAVRAGKRLLNDAVGVDLAQGLRNEATLQAGLIGRPNQMESVKSNIEKRPAVYQDPTD